MSDSIELKAITELNKFGKTAIEKIEFFIPDYQRGYRWTSKQVEDLIDDIFDFQEKKRKDPKSQEIYCIQPLVVKKGTTGASKGKYIVIDGQQRLTTIFLLLSFWGVDCKYGIEYETRTGSSKYLEKLAEVVSKIGKDETIKFDVETEKLIKWLNGTEKSIKDCADENIDFFHMYEAASTICNSENSRKVEAGTLSNIKFLWYLPKDAEDKEVFKALNVGKISLTEAELIKALFLNESNCKLSDEEKIRISEMWNQIECALQNDEFWYFLHEEEDKREDTRIEFIFDLIYKNDELKDIGKNHRFAKFSRGVKNKRIDKIKGADVQKTFLYFYEHFKLINQKIDDEEIKKKLILGIWNEVVCRYFYVLNEWYHDYKLYHYIGYLTSVITSVSETGNCTDTIRSLVSDWNNSRSKNEFVCKVERRILDDVLVKKEWIMEQVSKSEDWSDYVFEGDNKGKQECRCVLLLHNILTIVRQNEKLVADSKYNLPNFTKFPFHLYKKENWDIEHISSNSGDDLSDKGDQKLYLALSKEYVDAVTKAAIDDFLKDKGDKSFEDVKKMVDDGKLAKPDDKNKIMNFALLDRSTNREYQNAIFPVKRKFLAQKEDGYKVKYELKPDGTGYRESDREAKIAFVPICTKNAFAKHYSLIPTNMSVWTTEDASRYLEDIKDKVGPFMNDAVLLIWLKEKKKAVVKKLILSDIHAVIFDEKTGKYFGDVPYKRWAFNKAKYAVKELKSIMSKDSGIDFRIRGKNASTVLRQNYDNFLELDFSKIKTADCVSKILKVVEGFSKNTDKKNIKAINLSLRIKELIEYLLK